MKTKYQPTPYAKALHADRVAAQESEQATARPWDCDPANLCIYGTGKKGNTIRLADCTPAEDDERNFRDGEPDANLAMIVRAVNEYDALKAVAEAARSFQATIPLATSSATQLAARQDLSAALASLHGKGGAK